MDIAYFFLALAFFAITGAMMRGFSKLSRA